MYHGNNLIRNYLSRCNLTDSSMQSWIYTLTPGICISIHMPFRLRPRQPAPPQTHEAQKHLERPSAQDIYEQVANNARQELGRSSISLAISALAGGIFMGLSALGNAIAIALLTTPGTVPTHTIFFVGKMFYPLGFIVVILGRSQLFKKTPLPSRPRPRRKASLLAHHHLWESSFPSTSSELSPSALSPHSLPRSSPKSSAP